MISQEFNLPKPNATRMIKSFLEQDLSYLDKKEGRQINYKVAEYARLVNPPEENEEQLNKGEEKLQAKRTLSQPERMEKALAWMREQEKIQHGDYIQFFGVSPATATRDLKELVKSKKIKAHGKTRSKYYTLVAK